MIYVYCCKKERCPPWTLRKVCFNANRFEKKKNPSILPRSCDEEYLIYHALKCRFTDKCVVNKEQIPSALVNTALQELMKINLLTVILILIMTGKI